jgi:hypothetical protein
MRRTKKLVASLFASGILAAGLAAPTASAQPVVTGGVVNVTIVDLLDVTVRDVQVAVNAAANICDTDIIVNEDTGQATCTAIVGNRQNQ